MFPQLLLRRPASNASMLRPTLSHYMASDPALLQHTIPATLLGRLESTLYFASMTHDLSACFVVLCARQESFLAYIDSITAAQAPSCKCGQDLQ